MMSKPKKMSEETIKKVDEMFRDRWRTLLSVDVMVDKVVAALKHYDMLDDTYIILTSHYDLLMRRSHAVFIGRFYTINLCVMF